MLCNLLAPRLASQDTPFRKGISGEERLLLALAVMSGSKRFIYGGMDWGRGASTSWTAFYRVVDLIVEVLMPSLVKFPTGQDALACCRRFQQLSGLP